MDRTNVLSFAMGALIGFVVTALYLNEKHRNFIEEEAEFCESMAKKIQEEPEEKIAPIPKFETERKVLVMNRDRYKKVTTLYSPSEVRPIKSVPYVISFAEFCESYENHDKITITFYKGDNTLVDEEDGIIHDVAGAVGVISLECFGQLSDDPEVVYVRNELLGIDYEIVREEASYSEVGPEEMDDADNQEE